MTLSNSLNGISWVKFFHHCFAFNVCPCQDAEQARHGWHCTRFAWFTQSTTTVQGLWVVVCQGWVWDFCVLARKTATSCWGSDAGLEDWLTMPLPCPLPVAITAIADRDSGGLCTITSRSLRSVGRGMGAASWVIVFIVAWISCSRHLLDQSN